MPRSGYKSITPPEDLYNQLLERAKSLRYNSEGFIKSMVFDGTFLKSSLPKLRIPGSNPGGRILETSLSDAK